MAAYNEDSLKAELATLWPRYLRDHKPGWYAPQHPNMELGRAWALYQNSLNSQLPLMVLGDVTLRDTGLADTAALLRNLGTTSTRDPLNPDGHTRGMMGDLGIRRIQFGSNPPQLSASYAPPNPRREYSADAPSPHPSDYPIGTLLTRGSVLSNLNWWPLPNDAWLLGAIHGLRTFHLGKIPGESDVFDAKKRRPTVLGRELIGLAVFGYRRIKTAYAAMGHVIAPTNTDAALSATFTAYLDALRNFPSGAAILAGFANDQAIAYAEYETPNHQRVAGDVDVHVLQGVPDGQDEREEKN
jgi:hypothetical protein